ncbi:MAG: FAD-binding oxidoreductase [Thermoleophilaceae bacterium]|nr:FAD-binding oxidoreductase [Thermoleophilaceae bacterium]
MADIHAVTIAGTETEIPSRALDQLASNMRGELIRPGDPGYEPAREIWNGMIDRRPALVARCGGVADVAAAVNFARDNELLVAVRGGGHGVAGHALCDGGLVIDLSEMRAVDVDVEERTARAEGGCTLVDVDRETQRHGLATPLGVVSATGIAGLTLSGGMGWLRRRHGLSCDNLVSAQVVTADGSALTASETENEDLFWAIRGGGGNFGVVTSFEYRLHPVGPEVFVCFVFYPAEGGREVLQSCERYLSEAPEDVAPLAFFGRVPAVEEFPPESHGQPYVTLLAPHPGDPAEGERVLQPLREIADPIADLSATMPYTEAQAILDEDYPDGWRYYWKSVNVPELSDELIERLARHAAAAPSAHSTIDIWYQGGAMARVGEDETAFANRSEPYLLGIEGNSEDDAGSDENVAWVRDTFADMRSFSAGGVYLNFPGFLEEGKQLLREGYGKNYERLAEVKTRYDPGNLFRLNANIDPRS